LPLGGEGGGHAALKRRAALAFAPEARLWNEELAIER
jgi:hypothetical protein